MKQYFSTLVLSALFMFFCQNALAAKPVSQSYIDPSVEGAINTLSYIPGFHLVTHGRPGALLIEGEWKNAEKIATFLTSKLQATGVKHLNIYGCEFAKGEAGRAAVAYLAKATGFTVSASDDITGKDGDWELEAGRYVSINNQAGYNYNLQCADNTAQTIGPNTMSFPSSTYLHNAGTISTPIEGFNFTVNHIGDAEGIYWSNAPRLTVYSNSTAFRGGTFVFNKPLRGFYLFVGNLTSFQDNTDYEEAQITAYDVNNEPVRYTTFTEHAGYTAATQVFNSGATTTINARGESDGSGTARVTFYFEEAISKINITSRHSEAEGASAEIVFYGGCAVSETSLPVNFGKVIAEIKGNSLNVNWQTLTERNNDHFEIEVSKDGKSWSKASIKLSSKATNGSSDILLQYEQSIPLSGMAVMGISLFLLSVGMMFRKNKWLGLASVVIGMSTMLYGCTRETNSLPPAGQKIYVRVKQVDKNGLASYSKVVTAVIK